MSDIDQQFIEYVVKSLVGNPDAVHIDRRIDEKGVLLELTVDPEDLGRVIGKRGATAQSLRTLLRALGTKNDARYNLKIIDNGDPDYNRNNDASAAKPDEPQAITGDSPNDPADSPSTNEQAVATVDDVPLESSPESPAEEATPSPVKEEDHTSDRLQRARAEMADLDDLDV